MSASSRKNFTESDTGLLSLHPGGISLTLDAARKAGLKAGDRLLDIGCGTGASLDALCNEIGIKPFGIDVSCGIRSSEIVCGDASALPWPDGYFDAVMMECVLTLLDDPEAALAEAKRVLRPGGRFILSTLSLKKGVGNCSDSVCSDGVSIPDALKRYADSIGLELIYEEDRMKDLTDYMIESIMDYGSLEARINYEQQKTGASVFSCDTGCDYRTITYYLYLFVKQ